jgi:Transglutaminase-like superfamily
MTAATATATVAPPRQLRPAGLRLAAEIVWTTLRVRRLVRRNGLSGAVESCRAAVPSAGLAPSRDDVVRVGRAVRRTLGVLPGDRRGVVASLVHIAVLARRGVVASLVIGVRADKGLGAHAWVEVGGLPALPAAKDKFAQLLAL